MWTRAAGGSNAGHAFCLYMFFFYAQKYADIRLWTSLCGYERDRIGGFQYLSEE